MVFHWIYNPFIYNNLFSNFQIICSRKKIIYTFYLFGRKTERNETFLHLLFYNLTIVVTYTAISRKVVGKNVHATIPKGNMGYDQYTVPDDCSCRSYFCCFPLALANTFPWHFVPIPSNFFEKKRTQNHPQCLSGLSRALFPTTFLEIAVCRCETVPLSLVFNSQFHAKYIASLTN